MAGSMARRSVAGQTDPAASMVDVESSREASSHPDIFYHVTHNSDELRYRLFLSHKRISRCVFV